MSCRADGFDPVKVTTGAFRMEQFHLSLKASASCQHRTVTQSVSGPAFVSCGACPSKMGEKVAADFFACHLVTVTQ